MDKNEQNPNHAESQSCIPCFREDFLSIDYDPIYQWLYADWKGYQTEKSIKAGGEKMLAALIQFNCCKVLNDNTKVLGIWTPASKWTGINWFPRMVKAGLMHFAWIYSPSAFSRLSTDESLNNTTVKNVIRTFEDINSAREWLISCQE